MARSKKNITPREKPVAVKPSGRRESSFFDQVYEITRQIPRGRVTSYGAIAACAGTGLSARMVGWALNGAQFVRPRVPAHRVVNRKGLLTGKHHFSPPDAMQQLLEKEGIQVVDDQVQDFDKLFWDPTRNMG